jgi:O-antigen ligase
VSALQRTLSIESLTAFGQAIGRTGLAYVSLFFVALMWTLPFLFGEHYYPLTTFYQEWGAAFFGFCALPLLLTRRYWQQAEIPRIVLLPLGFLLLLWLQLSMGRVAYLSQAILTSLYLLWAALLMMLGHRLREELGLSVLVTALATFLLAGGELSALIGVAQKYEWRNIVFDYVVAIKGEGAIFANMGQPNHLANYTTLALISLGMLHTRWDMRPWLVVLLALPMLFVMVLSGSRSSWVYLLTLVIMAFLWQRRDRDNRPLLYYSVLLLVGFGLMHFVAKIPWLAWHNNITTVDRIVQATGMAGGGNGTTLATVSHWWESSIRLNIWHEAWLIFTQYPLLGAGFGQYGWQHFQLAAALHNTISPGLYNHAHSIVMETAAEMGSAGLLILCATAVAWVRQASRAPLTIYHWWGCGVMAVLAIHSLLEYPLFYAYFLGLAALTLGVLDYSILKLRFRITGHVLMAVILLLGALTLSQLWQGYRKIEAASAPVPADSNSEYERRLNFQHMRSIQGVQEWLWRSYIETSLGEMGWNHLGDKRAMNERVMRFSPISPAVYREATLLARAGQQAEAMVQMEKAIWCYPGDFPANLESLRKLAEMDNDPARYPALLEFALQKYEEQQRATVAH